MGLFKKQTSDYFTCKKNVVSFVLAVFVFIIHISSFAQYDLTTYPGPYFQEFRLFLKESVASVAVPLFLMISGALFYRDYNYEKTIPKLKSRIHSLVIPFLFWGLASTAFRMICSYSFISNYFIGRERATISVENVLRGVFHFKYLPPLWFLFNLIIFSLLSPIVFTLVKQKKRGLLSIVIVYILWLFNIRLPENVFTRADSILWEPPKTKKEQQIKSRNGIIPMGDERWSKQGYSMKSNGWNV